ncbi:hypothetical protein BC827DRAFT_1378126, partial [Russula dissimulans]
CPPSARQQQPPRNTPAPSPSPSAAPSTRPSPHSNVLHCSQSRHRQPITTLPARLATRPCTNTNTSTQHALSTSSRSRTRPTSSTACPRGRTPSRPRTTPRWPRTPLPPPPTRRSRIRTNSSNRRRQHGRPPRARLAPALRGGRRGRSVARAG